MSSRNNNNNNFTTSANNEIITVERRIEVLKNYFTILLYSNVCRSLFEKDKLLFSFLLTAKLQEANKKVTSNQYKLLVQPFSGHSNPLFLANPASDWLPDVIWNRLCHLAK